MFQPEILQPSWSYFDIINSSLDEAGGYDLSTDVLDINHCELSSLFTSSEDSPNISFSTPFMYSDEFMDFDQVHIDKLDATFLTDDLSLDMEELDPILSGELDDISGFLEESEESFSSQQSSVVGEDEWSLSQSMNTSDTLMDMASIQPSLTLPTEDMEIDNPLSILHLFTAYGEAMEKEQSELAEVIVKRISEKVSPVGEIMERLLFYLFQLSDKQSEYLKQASAKNFHSAFKAFYQIFPYGKFAHFAANMAILEAMPRDAEIIHMFDFDMGDGIQWSPMIEAIGCQQREVRLTSIKWSEGNSSNCDASQWKFEEVKRRLCNHARSFGLKLKVDEIELRDLMSDVKKMKKRGDKREWLAFNCMVSLPHMGRVRSRKDVMEFLRVAEEILATNSDYKGVITFGDGDAWEKYKNCLSFGSFLDGYLVHYQALLESMEFNFPIHLREARIAMECLFMAPFVSSFLWIQKWEEREECCDHRSARFWLEGWILSKESLVEAKEMVREGISLYGVRIEGENNNEMVLEWRGTELVRVSCWRS